jgi:hypothetical protein
VRQYTLNSENLVSSESTCRSCNFKTFKKSLLEQIRIEEILDYSQSQFLFACLEALEKGYHVKLESFLNTINTYETRHVEDISQSEKAKLYQLEVCFAGAIILDDKDAILLMHLLLKERLFQEGVSRMLPLILKLDANKVLNTLIDISNRGSAFKKSLVGVRTLYFLNIISLKDLEYQISNSSVLTYLLHAEKFDKYCPSYVALIKNLGLSVDEGKLCFADKFFYLNTNIQLLSAKILIKQIIRDPLGEKAPTTIKSNDSQNQLYKTLLFDAARHLSIMNICLNITFYECMRLIRCVEHFYKRIVSSELVVEFLQTDNPGSEKFKALDIAKKNKLSSTPNIAEIIKLSTICCIEAAFDTSYPVSGEVGEQLTFISKFCKIIIKDVIGSISIDSQQECKIYMA